MTLLAAFQTLLYRYSGQTTVCVGTPIANRNRQEISDLIGFFVNTLVMRAELSGDISFDDLLISVKEAALGAYAHQDLPFEQLVEALEPERSLSHSPLFQVMLAVQNAPREKLELEGLTLTPVKVELKSARFDITVLVKDIEQGVMATIEYNTDLFDAVTIERILSHYHRLLDSVATNASQRLGEIVLLDEQEREHLLIDLNETEASISKDILIHVFVSSASSSFSRCCCRFSSSRHHHLFTSRRPLQPACSLPSKSWCRAKKSSLASASIDLST